jgi:hypothetical protein
MHPSAAAPCASASATFRQASSFLLATPLLVAVGSAPAMLVAVGSASAMLAAATAAAADDDDDELLKYLYYITVDYRV